MKSNKKFLVTGGLGYIGSNVVVELIKDGADVVVLDNLSNTKVAVLEDIRRITGKQPKFVQGDILDPQLLKSIFSAYKFDSVFHFAGLKSVFESERLPEKYYLNNVEGSRNLLAQMRLYDVKTLVFSSSATVYGNAEGVEYNEAMPTNPQNVYGKTKKIVEDLLLEIQRNDRDWKIGILRYFNPVGSHESGYLGDFNSKTQKNLLPILALVADRKLNNLEIYGADFPTPDGTACRDYIHVKDLVAGHIAVLKYLELGLSPLIVNLGAGKFYSVLEIVNAFQTVNQMNVPYKIVDKRPCDLPIYYADTRNALINLGWKASLNLERMCLDVWKSYLFNKSNINQYRCRTI